MRKMSLCAGLLAIAAFPASSQILDVRELNTRQIGDLDRAKTVALIVGGILEEHGPYLPVYSDGYQTEFVAQRIAEAIVARPGWTVLRFPTLPLGSMPANEIGSRYAFPGSYPIRAATLRSVVTSERWSAGSRSGSRSSAADAIAGIRSGRRRGEP
jgi:creatinine amidohydrolase/Fe(II)-dependent formamide hydrolase-like protein